MVEIVLLDYAQISSQSSSSRASLESSTKQSRLFRYVDSSNSRAESPPERRDDHSLPGIRLFVLPTAKRVCLQYRAESLPDQTADSRHEEPPQEPPLDVPPGPRCCPSSLSSLLCSLRLPSPSLSSHYATCDYQLSNHFIQRRRFARHFVPPSDDSSWRQLGCSVGHGDAETL